MNWGQPYIKEYLSSDFVQYKCTEASFRLSKLRAVAEETRTLINNHGIMLTTTNFIWSMEKREGDENTTLHVPGTIIPRPCPCVCTRETDKGGDCQAVICTLQGELF